MATTITGSGIIGLGGFIANGDNTFGDNPMDILTIGATTTFSAEIFNISTGAIQVPAGTTIQRPTGANGKIRFNTTTSSYEGFKNGVWTSLGGGATGGGADEVFVLNDQTISNSYTIPTGKNASTAGPIELAEGVEVDISAGSVWSII